MYSFEIFPPKKIENFITLQETCHELNKLHPLFFSVTFGANGSSQTNTVKLVEQLVCHQFPIVPHLSSVMMTEPRLKNILEIYRNLNIKRLIVIRGDFPNSQFTQTPEYKYAVDLIKKIRQLTGDFFHITVAAYPEFHPEAASPEADLLHLKQKIEAGANSIITQFFFNTDAYFRFVDRCAKLKINVPIIPGVILIDEYQKLLHLAESCGTEIPSWMQKRLDFRGSDAKKAEEMTEILLELCKNLRGNGFHHMHFYVLNQAIPAQKIINVIFKDYLQPQHLLQT